MVEWLNFNNWDVYQEVAIGSSVADIVAVQGNIVWIIECKLSLSLELIGQAIEWIRIHKAHFISISIPKRRYETKGRYAAYDILKNYGIGMIEVPKLAEIRRQSVEPRFYRKAAAKEVKDSLCDQQKYFALAGSQSGYWTPFKKTCQVISRIVNRNPGITLKDLIDKSVHHYSTDKTARACISKYVRDGIIKGIRCEKDGKFLKFYPSGRLGMDPKKPRKIQLRLA